jgi:alkylhydroperoxidase/carboxymuconolactone decarboxylase family protein YurZ
MDQIGTAISNEQLGRLRHDYKQEDMINLLSSGMPGQDKRTAKYISAIRRTFYDSSRATMTPKDRERCLIAILSSRDAGLNLALHIYVGLMEDLSPQDIADIIFLGGIYTGVDRISDGLGAAVRTLGALARAADDPNGCGVLRVVGEFQATFAPVNEEVQKLKNEVLQLRAALGPPPKS